MRPPPLRGSHPMTSRSTANEKWRASFGHCANPFLEVFRGVVHALHFAFVAIDAFDLVGKAVAQGGSSGLDREWGRGGDFVRQCQCSAAHLILFDKLIRQTDPHCFFAIDASS